MEQCKNLNTKSARVLIQSQQESIQSLQLIQSQDGYNFKNGSFPYHSIKQNIHLFEADKLCNDKHLFLLYLDSLKCQDQRDLHVLHRSTRNLIFIEKRPFNCQKHAIVSYFTFSTSRAGL